jgi:hypothetical protein
VVGGGTGGSVVVSGGMISILSGIAKINMSSIHDITFGGGSVISIKDSCKVKIECTSIGCVVKSLCLVERALFQRSQ